MLLSFLFFFFSSRRRHTRFDCDWSSDVCSSDLHVARSPRPGAPPFPAAPVPDRPADPAADLAHLGRGQVRVRTAVGHLQPAGGAAVRTDRNQFPRSEEHTSELQSQSNLVCRLLLEKKKDEWVVLVDSDLTQIADIE